MTIDPTQSGSIAPHGPKGPAHEAPASSNRPAPPTPRGDRVEISAEARTLSAAGDADRVPFTEARIAELRAVVEAGHYERPEVVEELANRLADSGDL